MKKRQLENLRSLRRPEIANVEKRRQEIAISKANKKRLLPIFALLYFIVIIFSVF